MTVPVLPVDPIVRALPPEMMPATVTALVVLALLMVPPPAPKAILRVALIVNGLDCPLTNRAPPFMVMLVAAELGTAPRLLSALICNVPALIAKPPVNVLLVPRITVPAPVNVINPAPLTVLFSCMLEPSLMVDPAVT